MSEASKYEGHTPGKWRIDPASPLFVMGDGADGRVAYTYAAYADRTDAEARANAALIADAPELLRQRDALVEALKDAVALLDNRDRGFDATVCIGDLRRQVVEAADAAIAATKGGAK